MNRSLLAEALSALDAGRIVGVPTDTVYGLAVRLDRAASVLDLFVLKGRPTDRPVAVLGASIEQIENLVEMTPIAWRLAERYWPGPLTLVLPARRPLPAFVGDHEKGTLGVRVPDHGVALELLGAAGPLAVTSANPSGSEAACDDGLAHRVFGSSVAVYLPGNCPAGEGSTVFDLTSRPPRLVRPGPLGPEDLLGDGMNRSRNRDGLDSPET